MSSGWVSPKGSEIVGTFEAVFGIALINGIDEQGDPEYAGETKLDWNSQRSAHQDGKTTIYVDDEGDHWGFEQLLTEEVYQKQAERAEPEAGQIWRHCKGTLYGILDVTPLRDGDSEEKIVRYYAVGTGEKPHSRTMTNFLSRHTSGAWRFENADMAEDAING